MAIRTKLLILLLVICLVPLGILAGYSLQTTSDLGDQVGEHGREAMKVAQLAHLEEKLSDGVVIFLNQRALLAHLILDQARLVEASLASDAGDDPGTPTSAFDAGEIVTVEHPRYRRSDPEPSQQPMAVSFEMLAMHPAPGVELGEMEQETARLSSLIGGFRAIHEMPTASILWQYASLQNGVHAIYPAHGGYPQEFDPREREWYRVAMQAEGPVWSDPIIDVSTQQVVTSISVAVRDPEGRVVGVTGIDVSMPEIFNVVSAGPRQWSNRSEAMVVGRDEDGQLRIRVRERLNTERLGWSTALEQDTIADPDGLLSREFARAARFREVGLMLQPNRGVDSLWAFKQIEEAGPFLVVVVPLEDVIASARSMEAYIASRFGDQVWGIAAGVLLLALAMAIAARQMAARVTRPLELLSNTAREIASGNLESRSELQRADEIGSLAESIDDMARSIQKLMEGHEEAFLQAMKSLMKALGAKDSYTAAHSGRVKQYSLRLGRRLDLDDQTLDELGRGALVHDLGKIGIPERILNKPAPMDEAEYEVMKNHPKFSASIMRPLVRFRSFAEIAAWHHERWDGSGYPDGLEGEQIPLLARIVAIADAWDAMTGDRVYRQGMAPEVALDMIEEEQDLGQFDPHLIREFVGMMREELDGASESPGKKKRD